MKRKNRDKPYGITHFLVSKLFLKQPYKNSPVNLQA